MLLGLDLGTGSVKALLLAEDGSVRGEASAPYPVRSPRPGWAESNPGDWWGATAGAARPQSDSAVIIGFQTDLRGKLMASIIAIPPPGSMPSSMPLAASAIHRLF